MNEPLIKLTSPQEVYSSILADYAPPTEARADEFMCVLARLMHRYMFADQNSYALRFQTTSTHLGGAVHLFTGMSFMEFRDKYIMLAAYELLEKTSLSVQEVAKRLNFTSDQVFIQFFKRHATTTPQSWRVCLQRSIKKEKTAKEIATEEQRRIINK